MKTWIDDMKKVFLFSVGDFINHWLIIIVGEIFIAFSWSLFMKMEKVWLFMLYIYLVIGYFNLLLNITRERDIELSSMFLWARNLKQFFVVYILTFLSYFSIKISFLNIINLPDSDPNKVLYLLTAIIFIGILIIILGFIFLELIDNRRKILSSIKYGFKISFEYMGEIALFVFSVGILYLLSFLLSLVLFPVFGLGFFVGAVLFTILSSWIYLYYVNLYEYIDHKESLKNN